MNDTALTRYITAKKEHDALRKTLDKMVKGNPKLWGNVRMEIREWVPGDVQNPGQEILHKNLILDEVLTQLLYKWAEDNRAVIFKAALAKSQGELDSTREKAQEEYRDLFGEEMA